MTEAMGSAATAVGAVVAGVKTTVEWVEKLYDLWSHTPMGFVQRKLSEALVSDTLPGVQREAHRGVDDAVAAQDAHRESVARRGRIASFFGDLFGGESVAPTAALAASAGIAPSQPAVRANTIQAGRTVNISGGINVSVDGLADGTTGEAVAQQVHENVSRVLSSAAASQGAPG